MKFSTVMLPVLSSLAMMLSLFFCLPFLGMVSMVPLLFSLHNCTFKVYIKQLLIFSLVYTGFLFFWMISSSAQFTGNVIYGLIGMVFSVLLFTLLYSGVFLVWRKLCSAVLSWPNIILLAGLFVLMEWVGDYVFDIHPWYSSQHFGSPLIGSVYTIQLSEIGGVYLLTFFMLIINGGIAYSLKEKRQFKIVTIIIIFFFSTNVLFFHLRTERNSPENEIKINLLNANVSPLTNWELEGNEIVPEIISLSRQKEISSTADFNVWTESVVPWNYQVNDDFVNEVLTNASEGEIINLIGMNTEYEPNVVYNSAYVISGNKTMLGRYDKVNPLALMERPFKNNATIQVANNDDYVKPGAKYKPIATKKGYVGIYICNEATIAAAVTQLVKNGADFLVNVSNDGWFKDTHIPLRHFYYNRLRAVENRRDIAVNSNLGYSGKVISSGEVLIIEQSDTPTFNQITVNKSNTKTIYNNYPHAFVLIITIINTMIILFKRL